MLVLKFDPVILPVVLVDQSPLLGFTATMNETGNRFNYSYQFVPELAMPEDREALTIDANIRARISIGDDNDPSQPWERKSYEIGLSIGNINYGGSGNYDVPTWIPYFNNVQPNQSLRARLHAFVSMPWKRHYVIKKLIND